MTDQEEQFYMLKKYIPKQLKLHTTLPLFFITNNNNKDSVLLQQQIQDIFFREKHLNGIKLPKIFFK